MLKRHFGVHFSFQFSIQYKSSRGSINTIVGQVAVPFFGPIGHPGPRSPSAASPHSAVHYSGKNENRGKIFIFPKSSEQSSEGGTTH